MYILCVMTVYANFMTGVEHPEPEGKRLERFRLSSAISGLLGLNGNTDNHNDAYRFAGSIIHARDLRGDDTIYFGFDEQTPKMTRDKRRLRRYGTGAKNANEEF